LNQADLATRSYTQKLIAPASCSSRATSTPQAPTRPLPTHALGGLSDPDKVLLQSWIVSHVQQVCELCTNHGYSGGLD
jgi:hypothetical protein